VAMKCSKCGEEMLGAVNRCWRCGQMFAAAPPQTRAATMPVAAILAEQLSEPVDANHPALETQPIGWTHQTPHPRLTTAELIDARRAGMMAMGGTVTSLVLGLFATVLAIFWPPAAIVAVLGLAMGLWGLSSPRRNLALVGMLFCCLAIGIGAYGFARSISIAMQKTRPVQFEDNPTADGN
jgi:hypothetical protein